MKNQLNSWNEKSVGVVFSYSASFSAGDLCLLTFSNGSFVARTSYILYLAGFFFLSNII